MRLIPLRALKTVENIYQEARETVGDVFVIAFDLGPLLVLVLLLRMLKIGMMCGEK